jgi:hypothetical protein
MHRQLNAIVRHTTIASLLAFPIELPAVWAQTTTVVGQRRAISAATTLTSPQVIRDRIDTADDVLGDLLYMQPIITNDAARQSNTLVNVDAKSIEKLRDVLESIVVDLPARRDRSSSETRGDLRAHAEKAVEIAVELGSRGGTGVGTSGTAATTLHTPNPTTRSCTVTVDRTALERLQVEVNAMALLEPQS